jgi:acetyl-CoA carboxylase beta subunit
MKKLTKINYEEIKKLKSFHSVELKGNETFDELLEIEKKEEKKKMLKGTVICKAKNCSNFLYKNNSSSNIEYCSECF